MKNLWRNSLREGWKCLHFSFISNFVFIRCDVFMFFNFPFTWKENVKWKEISFTSELLIWYFLFAFICHLIFALMVGNDVWIAWLNFFKGRIWSEFDQSHFIYFIDIKNDCLPFKFFCSITDVDADGKKTCNFTWTIYLSTTLFLNPNNTWHERKDFYCEKFKLEYHENIFLFTNGTIVSSDLIGTSYLASKVSTEISAKKHFCWTT